MVPAAFPVGEFCLQQSVFTVVQEALLVRNVLATPGRKTCPVHAAHPPLSPAAAMGVLSPPRGACWDASWSQTTQRVLFGERLCALPHVLTGTLLWPQKAPLPARLGVPALSYSNCVPLVLPCTWV